MENKIANEDLNGDLVVFQNRQNLEHLCKKIKIIKTELEKEMISYGMTEKAVGKILSGEEVIVCGDCGTPNMYLDFSHPAKLYRCSNSDCNATYVP